MLGILIISNLELIIIMGLINWLSSHYYSKEDNRHLLSSLVDSSNKELTKQDEDFILSTLKRKGQFQILFGSLFLVMFFTICK